MPNTPNFDLPLLFAAQAQKEITHNEAIVLIDALLAARVEAVRDDPETLVPAEGQVWIVGSGAAGVWSGRAGQLAVFTPGGWRFAPPAEGMQVYDRAANVMRLCDGAGWSTPAAIAAPAGGANIDNEARSAIVAILAALRDSGIVAAS